MPYFDLHQHLKNLEAHGLLRRITRLINKDTELHPLVRWQYVGGIAEHERKAFLFTNVVDGRGRKYKFPVVVGAFAGNRRAIRTTVPVSTLPTSIVSTRRPTCGNCSASRVASPRSGCTMATRRVGTPIVSTVNVTSVCPNPSSTRATSLSAVATRV